MDKKQKDISSLILNRRFQQKETYNSISMPIYGGVTFEFDTAKEMEDAFLSKKGNVLTQEFPIRQ